MTPPVVIAVVGLRREARILGLDPARIIIGGGRSDGLRRRLDAAIAMAPGAGVLSFGLAGALCADCPPGTLLIGESVWTGDAAAPTDPAWRESLLARLPEARAARIAGVDVVAATPADKSALRVRSQAHAVDMESHVAAAAAAAAAAPFAIVRAISDGAATGLPPAALAGFGADGGVDVLAVIAALARRPWDLPGLLRAGADARAGFSALLGGRRRLGATLGFPDV